MIKNLLQNHFYTVNIFYKIFITFIFFGVQILVFAQGLDVPEDPPSPPSAPESGIYPEVSCGDVQLNCNLFANGSFESGMGCAMIMSGGQQSLESGFDCVSGVSGTPDRFSATCTSATHLIPTAGSIDFLTSFGVYGGTNNFHFLGLRGNNGYTESVVATLAMPLVAGNTYNLSLYAIRSTKLNLVAPNVSVYGSTSFVNFQDNTFDPAGLTLLYSTSVNTITETWTQFTPPPFVAPNNFSHLVIVNNNTFGNSYVGIDDFTITQSTNTGTINAGADFQISCGQSHIVNAVAASCNPNNWSFELFLDGVLQAVQPTSSFVVNTPGSYTINFLITINGLQTLVASDSFIATATPLSQCFSSDVTFNTDVTLPTTTYVGQNIAMNANIYINAGSTVTFSSCDLLIFSGKKITINPGGELKINYSSLKACEPCGAMWEGIVVRNGGKLTIDACNIKDANAAVQTEAVALGYTGTLVPNITIRNTLFNKNTYSVWLKSHPKNIVFLFNDNVITCRDIPGWLEQSYASYANWLAVYTPFRSNLINNDLSYPHGQTILNVRSDIGVRVDDLIASSAIQLGTADPVGRTNIIDYQNYGTQITNTNFTAYNNIYQFHLKINTVPSTAIIAPTSGNTNLRSIIIGDNAVGMGHENKFYDNYNAIDIDKQRIVYVYRNNFINSTTSNAIGNNGIFAKNTSTILDISNNTEIRNYVNAIQMSRNTAAPSLNPTFSIVNNKITQVGTGVCNYAIYARDVANSIFTNLGHSNKIDNNFIENTKFGITISNIKNPTSFSKNNVTILNTPAPTIVWTIKLETCQNITAKGNNLSANTTGVPSNEFVKGFWAIESPKCIFWCNTLSHLGKAIEYEGNCITTISAGLKSNTIGTSRTGLALNNNAVIGQQGSATEAIQMTYTGSFVEGQTKTFSSSLPTSSKLYDFQTNLPTNNLFFGAPPYVLGTSLFPASNTPYVCPQSNGDDEELVVTFEIVEEYAQELAIFIDHTDSIVYDDALQYEIDKFVYNEVRDIALLSQVNDTLEIYGDSTLTDPMGRFRKVDDKIGTGLYTQAQTINMNTVPGNVKEINQKSFNTIYIAKLANPNYAISNSDKDVLNSIATQCAYLGGNSVIQARNFLMAIEDRLIEFIDSCGPDSSFALPKSLKHSNDECQNYVQNGTFSEYVNCPEYASGTYPDVFEAYGTQWKAFGGTPDYINICSQDGAYIPYCNGGITWPIGDSAYMGISPYASLETPQHTFEILGSNLCDQLEANENYCTKLFVSSAEANKYYVSSFGVYFAEEEFYYDTMEVDIIPQLLNPSTNFLSDTGWASLEWVYPANGNEDVIAIGNFETQENTDTTTSPYDFASYSELYYSIENVSIEKLIAVNGGSDRSIIQGESVLIGTDPTEVADYSWTTLQGDGVSTSQYPTVSPDSTTTYIVTKNQCNVLTTDTVTVFVSPTALAEIGAIGYFNLYPNPAKDAVNIYFQSGQEVIFELYDIAGHLIYSQVFPQGKNGYILPLNNYANGIYICNLKTRDGHQEQRKLMIAR